MTSFASYFIAGLAAVLVTDYFNPIAATGPLPYDAIRVEPATAISTQFVDRTHKGDRLSRRAPRIVTVRDFAPVGVRPVRLQIFRRPQPVPLPVGCDALAGALDESPLSDLAGRCLTDLSRGGLYDHLAGKGPRLPNLA
jgi:hypothetical protein